MAYISNDRMLVFGASERPEAEKLNSAPHRAVDVLGQVTRDSLDELMGFVGILVSEGRDMHLSEVELHVDIELSGKLAIPLLGEASLGGQTGITLRFDLREID
jgi:hypothetical protein